MTIGNGSIPLRIGRLIDTTVYGGPYRDVPVDFWGVKMAEEIEHPHMVDIPTKDYCVPKVSDLKAGIVKSLMAMINEEDVYAGCWGGIGRTGLFLAALAKVQIEYRKAKHRPGRGEDPVLYVRKHFIPHAVETKEQMKYIDDLDVSDIVAWLDMTQTAMGLGGLTPAKKQPVDLDMRHPHGNVPVDSRVGKFVAGNWIPEDEKIDNPAFDGYKADWKSRQCDATLEALDSGSTDSLQTQIWKLEEKLGDQLTLMNDMTHTIKILNSRVSNTSNNVTSLANICEKTLTKPSLSARIRTWLANH